MQAQTVAGGDSNASGSGSAPQPRTLRSNKHSNHDGAPHSPLEMPRAIGQGVGLRDGGEQVRAPPPTERRTVARLPKPKVARRDAVGTAPQPSSTSLGIPANLPEADRMLQGLATEALMDLRNTVQLAEEWPNDERSPDEIPPSDDSDAEEDVPLRQVVAAPLVPDRLPKPPKVAQPSDADEEKEVPLRQVVGATRGRPPKAKATARLRSGASPIAMRQSLHSPLASNLPRARAPSEVPLRERISTSSSASTSSGPSNRTPTMSLPRAPSEVPLRERIFKTSAAPASRHSTKTVSRSPSVSLPRAPSEVPLRERISSTSVAPASQTSTKPVSRSRPRARAESEVPLRESLSRTSTLPVSQSSTRPASRTCTPSAFRTSTTPLPRPIGTGVPKPTPPPGAISKRPLTVQPIIWAKVRCPTLYRAHIANLPAILQSRQEVCESFDWFRSYQGGVYFNNDIAKGYLLGGFHAR